MQSETDERDAKMAAVTLSTEYGPRPDRPSPAATAKRLSSTAAGREHLWSRAILHFRHIIPPLLLTVIAIGGMLIWNWLRVPPADPVAIEEGRSLTTSIASSSSSPSTSEAASGPVFAEPSFTERTRTDRTVAPSTTIEPRRAPAATSGTTTTTVTSTSTSTSTSVTSTTAAPTTTEPPPSSAPEPDCDTTSSRPGKRKGQQRDDC